MQELPNMVEPSVYNTTDIVVGFPIVSKPTSIYKSDLLGIKQLEYVKKAQNVWIEHGTNHELCVQPWLRHNVSNTITVDNWDEVFDYVYDNKESFCGISFMAASGDKAYPQAPFTEIFTYDQIVAKYGEVSLFTSALIEAGLDAFNGDLWKACNTALGYGDKLEDGSKDLLKRDWVRRFNKFSENFKAISTKAIEDELTKANGIYAHKLEELIDEINEKDDDTDFTSVVANSEALYEIKEQISELERKISSSNKAAMEECSYCLKDVYNLHKWWRIQKGARDIDFTQSLTAKKYTDINTMGAQACSGGQCEISF